MDRSRSTHDTLGWRRVYGIVTPSTATSVQPEYDDMRPPGVTNQVARMHIPDEPLKSDADFDELHRSGQARKSAANDHHPLFRHSCFLISCVGWVSDPTSY